MGLIPSSSPFFKSVLVLAHLLSELPQMHQDCDLLCEIILVAQP